MARRRQFVLRPACEQVERRSLLSIVTALASESHPTLQVSAALLEARHPRAAASSNQAVPLATTNTGGIGSIGPGGTPLLGTGQPTARELARDTFKAYFNGPLLVGPGRFSDQARIIYIRGVGGSSFFRHGDMNLGIVVPTDPNANFTGVVYLQDKNINSGAAVAFDMTGARTSVDRHGRPTQLTFVADPNIYSGIFYANSASGTVNIVYQGTTATVRISGLVYTSGLTNPLKNAAIVSRGGVPFART
jgi:hypothetical protein